ncbi:MAG: hypothetical protein AAF614_39735 [Chloroflexota bacterium]
MEENSSSEFDWRIYAEATFAGLSVLIPIPLLDLAFEWLFRRRIPKAIAKRNGRLLDPVVVKELNRTPLSCLALLFWPVTLTLEFLKRFYRTVLYFLTIKDATDRLSYYWHRAFLIDYMFRQGYFDEGRDPFLAVAALNRLLGETTTSPLLQLASQIIALPQHIFRTLRRLLRRQSEEDDTILETKIVMAENWQQYDSYWRELSQRYESTFQALAAERNIPY